MGTEEVKFDKIGDTLADVLLEKLNDPDAADETHELCKIEIVPETFESPELLDDTESPKNDESNESPKQDKPKVISVKIHIKKKKVNDNDEPEEPEEDQPLLDLQEVDDEPIDMDDLQDTIDEIVKQEIEKQEPTDEVPEVEDVEVTVLATPDRKHKVFTIKVKIHCKPKEEPTEEVTEEILDPVAADSVEEGLPLPEEEPTKDEVTENPLTEEVKFDKIGDTLADVLLEKLNDPDAADDTHKLCKIEIVPETFESPELLDDTESPKNDESNESPKQDKPKVISVKIHIK